MNNRASTARFDKGMDFQRTVSDNSPKKGILTAMATTYKTRSSQEPGLVSLEPLLPSLGAVWTIGAFGRQRLYILSGKFGPDRQFCSRYVVFPEPSGLGHWRFHVLTGKQDYTKGRLDILQERLLEMPDAAGQLEHSINLGTAADAQQAQRGCVDHAIASGNGKEPGEEI